VTLIKERYADFGPTLAAEKLAELHGIRVSRETLRNWMRADGLWLSRKDRTPAPHQPRYRRECFGELVQIDGSDHDWFEGRGDRCSLLVFVDDATGQLMELLFVTTETAFGYFAATTSYLKKHGKPVAFYSDKHSIFRVAREGSTGAHAGVSQFGRALSELNIDIICANTPQAKGRVERMNKTLQDRLVKELRLRGISTMDAANTYLHEFVADFNARFARPARSPHNAHRPLLDTEDLGAIFCLREARSMSANLVVHYERTSYVVTPGPETTPLSGHRRKVEVRKWADGRIEIRHEGVALPYTIHDNYPFISPGDIVENKRIDEAMAEIKAAQRNGRRTQAAVKRFSPGGRTPLPSRPKMKQIAAEQSLVAPPVEPPANHFLIRWLGQIAHLYERSFVMKGTDEVAFKEQYLGPVEARVAMKWEARGNPLYPPPLVGAKVSAAAAARVPLDGPKDDGPERLPRHADGLSRLSAALWFADVLHAAETERVREHNQAVEAFNRDLYRAPVVVSGARKPPQHSRSENGECQDEEDAAIGAPEADALPA
jgi:hypothetical protein